MKKQLHVFKKSSIAAALLFFSLVQANGVPCVSPTLSTVTAATACNGSTTNIMLSGLLQNTFGTATFKINNGPLLTASGTTTAMGTFSFQTPILSSQNNGAVVEITKITTSAGCETSFTGKTVTLVVIPRPTLTTVTAAPACSGGTTNIVLSGLLPNTTGVATYKIGNSQPFTQAGTSTASGLFIFPTPTLSANANGLVVEITKITYANGCDTNFTDKKVTLVVQTCSPKEAITPVKGNRLSFAQANGVPCVLPTLSTVTAATACNGSTTNIMLSGLLQNTFGTATFKINNGPLLTTSGTTTAMGTFSIQTPILSSQDNGAVVEITKISTAAGCETSFTGKTVTLVVIPRPTLTTVTAAPACSGGTTNIVLAGLLPNTTGVATYKIGNLPPFTQAGTSTVSGLFIFPTPTLSANANGLVVEITKITYANGCDTNFTGKKVTLVVQTCSPKEAITPVKGNQDVAGSLAELEGQGIKKITLYPNPTSDVLNIQTEAGIQSVEIFNLQGQRVLTSQQKEITVSQLQAGAYLIRIQDSNNNVISKKFIKK